MINLEKERCKLCGNHLKPIAENLHDNRYGMQGKFSIGFCFSCELGETFPKPSFKDAPSMYKEAIGDSKDNWFKMIYRKCKRSLTGTKLILKSDRAGVFYNLLPSPSKFPRLLDVGCGVGDWMILFNEMGFEAQGIDLNPRVVEVAIGRGLSVECRRFEELVADRETFNIIVLSQVLEHLLEPKDALKKIHKLLQPGGKLLISVPNFGSQWRIFFKNYWINWYMPFHLFHFAKKSLLKILMESGFKVERVNCYTPPTWWISSLMVRLFDHYGKPNKNVTKWWHYLLLPFIMSTLLPYEKLMRGHEGDCLCVIAKSEM